MGRGYSAQRPIVSGSSATHARREPRQHASDAVADPFVGDQTRARRSGSAPIDAGRRRSRRNRSQARILGMTAFSDGERTDPLGGRVVRRVGAGVLYRNDRFAHLYWHNLLAVDPASELSAEALIAEADRLFAGIAIRRRRRHGQGPLPPPGLR